ncbi:MAG: class I SAM-dependent methyltransferase [Actinobacteria bacterium]|nr:class I SAM-dependent methyltransferase [Actinomycetota bacterium]
MRRLPILWQLAGVVRAVVHMARNRSLRTVIFAPPGHFYSPLPRLRDYQHPEPRSPSGVHVDVDTQRRLATRFGPYTPDRWQPDQTAFPWDDAFILAGMIGVFEPSRIVEVGSGWSSAVMLDTSTAELTFIDPHPRVLARVMRPEDEATVIARPVQKVSLGVFSALRTNDFLFVDSTHVVKVGSDVHRIVFEILPALVSGVIIHFHDIFWPFEYPEEWIRDGRAWNEAYVLEALLSDNPHYEILYFSSLMGRDGGSLWLRKV